MRDKRQFSSDLLNVLIWRTDWLSYSETFVELQARNLQESRAIYAGLNINPRGRQLGATSVVTTRRFSQFLQKLALSRLGWSPTLRNLVYENNAKVVHAHFGPDGVAVARFCRRYSLPLVLTLHGYDVSSMAAGARPRNVAYRRKLRSVMLSASKVICVSNYVHDLALRLGSPAENTVVHYIGVEIPDLPPHPVSRTGLLFVGRLVEKKGLDTLLHALGRLEPKLRLTPITVIGDGPLRQEMEQLSASMNLRVEFKGALSHTETLREMDFAMALVVPSRRSSKGDVEGLPTVIMEAMARAVPVIGTKHSGIPEAVRDGIDGLLCDEHDVQGFSQNLRKFLLDPTGALAMGESARNRAEELFDVASQAKLLDSIYFDALSPISQ